ncbi:MAG: hypothetical protein FWE36_00445 [Erysipelotrichales bacterium]|nr:hypothetical protein [Erysipelotrichales bacterium]
MRKYLIGITVVLCFAALFVSGKIYAFGEETLYEINHEVISEELEIITISKETVMVTPFRRNVSENVLTEERVLELSETYDLDTEKFTGSYGVKIQLENISPHWGDCCCDTPEPPSTLVDEWHNQLRFMTFIYFNGFNPSGARMYQISANVIFNQQLPTRAPREDRLTIWHSPTAIVDARFNHLLRGAYRAEYRIDRLQPSRRIHEQRWYNVSIQGVHHGSFGVDYRFNTVDRLGVPTILDTSPHPNIPLIIPGENLSRSLDVSGSSFILVERYANIQITYFHNTRSFGGSLSLNFGVGGVSLPVGSNEGMTFRGRMILLQP